MQFSNQLLMLAALCLHRSTSSPRHVRFDAFRGRLGDLNPVPPGLTNAA